MLPLKHASAFFLLSLLLLLPLKHGSYLQAASDVYSPISGEVVEINQALVDEPAKVSHTLASGQATRSSRLC